MPADAVLVGHYDFRLVALSWIISTFAAYAALDLAGRVTASRGRLRFIWLAGGAAAMGMGIWSMHYIGMLAYRLPIEVLYDWPQVLLSLAAAFASAAVALFIVSRSHMGAPAVVLGGLLMGMGIASMHYIGMEAMRLSAMCHYSFWLVFLSVVLAIVIAMTALWLSFHLRSETQSLGWRKLASTVLMGAAIPVMHYTGMAAVSFTPMQSSHGSLEHAVGITSLGTAGIAGISLLVLMLTILTSFVDRRFSAQALELQLSEQRYRELVESAQVILWRSDSEVGEFSYVNHRAEELLGYAAEEWTNARGFWIQHIHPEDRALVHACCASALQQAGSRQFEHRMVASKGEILWFRTSILPVAGGEAKELVGVMTDITDRKRAQEEVENASREIERLNYQLKRENSRMSAELDITKRLQQMILPREEELRQIRGLDISGSMEPAAEVGGDYYDVVPQDGRVVFGIGDVTGHGLESGVIAIMVQTAVRTLLAAGFQDTRKFFDVLNQIVYTNAERMNCIRNLSFSLLDYRDKVVTISGQHEEVLVVRQNGHLERHDTLDLGFPLGLEKEIAPFIAEAKIPLQTGDVMVIYTDGVTEAVNSAGTAYGIERLCEVVRSKHRELAAGIREAILHNVHEFIGGERLLDDISLLVIKHA